MENETRKKTPAAERPEKRRHNRVKLLICCIIPAILLAAGVVFGMNEIGKNAFLKAAPDASAELRLSDATEKRMRKILAENDSDNEKLNRMLADAVPVDEAYLPMIERCKQQVAAYCRDVLQYDVSPLLDRMQVYMLPGLEPYASGLTMNDAVYLDKTILEGPEEFRDDPAMLPDLSELLLHETVHYVIWHTLHWTEDHYIDEGITDLIAQEIARHGNNDYTPGYTVLVSIAQELLKADPDLTGALLKGEAPKYPQYFAQTYGIGFYDAYNNLITMLNRGAATPEVKFGVQYYTAEIVKLATDGDLSDFTLSLDPFFGLHYLFRR